jgi:hypothetical protein
MQIGEKTISAMKAMAAFLKSEDSKLKVSLTFDIAVSETKPNGIDLDATISFTESKVKEKVSTTVMENQVDLPFPPGTTIKIGDDPKVYKLNGE